MKHSEMSDDPPTPTNDYLDLLALSREENERITAHFRAVSVVASMWAGYELALDGAILVLGRIPRDAGLSLTAQIAGQSRKLDAYMALVRLRGDDSFTQELEAFAKASKSVGERRNRVIHDPWLLFSKQGTASRLETTARRKLRHKFVEATPPELVRLINDINDLQNAFYQLHERIMLAVGGT